MSITYPTTIDSPTNPTAGAPRNNPSLAGLITDLQAIVVQLETKVGVNSSAVTTTLDYKLSGITGTDKAVSKTGVETMTNKTLTAPQINMGSDAAGDIYIRNASGVTSRLAAGAASTILNIDSVTGLPAWVANPAASDGSTTVKGVFEEATQAETDAGTAAGGTLARLVVNPSALRARLLNTGVVDTGTGAAYAIAPSPAITAYATYQQFTFKAVNANTVVAPTVNANAIGAKTIVNPDGTPLRVGQIPANAIITVIYDGTNMQLTSIASSQSPVNATYYSYQATLLTNFVGFQTVTGSPASTVQGVGGYFRMTAAGAWNVATGIPGIAAAGNYVANNSKSISIKFRCAFSGNTTIAGFGLIDHAGPANIYTAQTDVNAGVRIINNAGTLYAQNANGSTATSTNISGSLTLTNFNVYEFVFTPGTDVKFYVNGTLVATQTTNLPTSQTLDLAYGAAASLAIDTMPPQITLQA